MLHIHLIDLATLAKWMVANPTEALTHVVAYSSAAVVALASIQRFLRETQDWVIKWFPDSPKFIKFLDKSEYILAATSDLVENLALNWRSKIAPKRWVGSDRRGSEKADSAIAGGGNGN